MLLERIAIGDGKVAFEFFGEGLDDGRTAGIGELINEFRGFYDAADGFSERRAGAVKATFQGCDGNLQGISGFFRGKSFDIA